MKNAGTYYTLENFKVSNFHLKWFDNKRIKSIGTFFT